MTQDGRDAGDVGPQGVPATAGERLRSAIAATSTLVVPGCYDPLSARVIELAGFPAVYMGGYATGAHLGFPPPQLNVSDMADAAARVSRVVGIPLITDGEDGWGDVLQTERSVRALERAGVAAFHFEDYPFPKRASYYSNVVEVMGRTEFLRKLEVARESRQDRSTMIVGRTDAYDAVNGSDHEAYERATAMAEMGSELVFVYAPDDIDHLRRVRAALPDVGLFTIALGEVPRQVYEDLGYDVVVYPTAAVVVAVRALRELWHSVGARGTTTYVWDDHEEQRAHLRQVLRLDALAALEQRNVVGP